MFYFWVVKRFLRCSPTEQKKDVGSVSLDNYFFFSFSHQNVLYLVAVSSLSFQDMRKNDLYMIVRISVYGSTVFYVKDCTEF